MPANAKAIRLSDGTEVFADLSRLTRQDQKEWAACEANSDEYDVWLGVVCGLSFEEINRMSSPDWILIVNAVAEEMAKLTSPNSKRARPSTTR